MIQNQQFGGLFCIPKHIPLALYRMFYEISFTRCFWNVYGIKVTKKALKKTPAPLNEQPYPLTGASGTFQHKL